MRPAGDTTGRSEAAFSLVEVMVAAVIVGLAISGIVAVAGSTTRSTAQTQLQEQQSALIQSLGEKMRSDPSWAQSEAMDASPTHQETCASLAQHPTVTLDGSKTWIRTRMATEKAADNVEGSNWDVKAVASKVDSPADGACGTATPDKDGIVPDYYNIALTVSPSTALAQRFPGLETSSSSFDVDFASRSAGGTLMIQACYVTPQADERQRVATCEATAGTTSNVALLAPTGTALQRAGSAWNLTCLPAAIDAECAGYRCAHPYLNHGGCSRYATSNAYVRVQTRPASGWRYSVKGDDDVTRSWTSPESTGTLDALGRKTLRYMPIGRYKVTITSPNPAAYEEWESHSVPSSGSATVQKNENSMVVQMFKPAHTGAPLTIRFETIDDSFPPGFPERILPTSPETRTLALKTVPMPISRMPNSNETVSVPPSSTSATLTNNIPGLTAPWLTGPTGLSRMPLDDIDQFLFIHSPADGNPGLIEGQHLPTLPLLRQHQCRPDERKAAIMSVATTPTIDPVKGPVAGRAYTYVAPDGATYTWTYEECTSEGDMGGTQIPPFGGG